MKKLYHNIISTANIAAFLLILAFCSLASAATVTYTYDNLNRLTKVDYGAGNAEEFTYDAAGNRLSLLITGKGTHIITTSVGTGSGTMICTPNPVDDGSTSSCNVTPTAGYHITSVSGCGGTDPGPQGNNASYSYGTGAITTECTVTAAFAINQHNLNVAINPSSVGNGTVGGSGTFGYGTTHQVTATASTGSTFTGWSGDCSGTTSPYNVTMLDRDMTCTATITLNQHNLNVAINPSSTGSGTVGGSGTLGYGTTHQATATASTGSTFTGWTGDCSGTTSPYNVTMLDRDMTCTATFSVTPPATVTVSCPTGKGNIILETTSPGCGFSNVQTQTKEQAGNTDSYEYPYGFVSFSVNCASADVKITYTGASDMTGYAYRKFGPTTPGDPATAKWYTFSNVTISGNTITLHLVDGELGDDTGVDGVIVDQGGPGDPPPQPVAIPTMNEWGIIIFIILAGLGSVYYLRRRRV